MRTQHTWRNAYADLCIDLLDANPDISRHELAQRLDMSPDEVEEILTRLIALGVVDKPTRTSPRPVLQHRLGSFK
jgi:Mn-dependent DtxR family transcriptional regulator